MSSDPVADPSSIPFLVGKTFHERYEVLRCISSGGMGAVYEAVHLETRRRCALKVMLPSLVRDPEHRARFKLECTVASDIESEHIVQVLDAGVDAASGLPFLVMELLKGEELFDMLERRATLSPDEVVLYLYQAALALERTHAAGIVHRDLKPENLFVTYRDDGSPRVKILDFGIAKVLSQQDKITTGFMGTPLYMAPEQLTDDGDISARSDLYALGQLAFTMLVGTPYWDLESREGTGLYKLAMRIGRGIPEPASARAERYGAKLPPAIDAWFAKATARDPKDRFRRGLNLVASLADALGVSAPQGLVSDEERARPHPLLAPSQVELRADSAAPTSVAPRSLGAPRRVGLVASVLTVVVGLTALAVALFLLTSRGPSTSGAGGAPAPVTPEREGAKATVATSHATAELQEPLATAALAPPEAPSAPAELAPSAEPSLTVASTAPGSATLTRTAPRGTQSNARKKNGPADPLDVR